MKIEKLEGLAEFWSGHTYEVWNDDDGLVGAFSNLKLAAQTCISRQGEEASVAEVVAFNGLVGNTGAQGTVKIRKRKTHWVLHDRRIISERECVEIIAAMRNAV